MYTDGRRKVACNFRNGQMRKRKNSKGKLVSLASCDLLFHVSYLSISILPSSCFFLFFFSKIVSIIDFYERSGGVYSDTFLRKFLKEEQYLSPNTWIQISRFFAREGENLDGSNSILDILLKKIPERGAASFAKFQSKRGDS